MIALRDPQVELKRPTRAPVKRPAPIQRPEAEDDPMVWRESDFAPVKIRGEPLSHTVIEDRR